MSIIQFQTARCWKEYMSHINVAKSIHDDNDKFNNKTEISQLLLRNAEIRIATLIRCLDYSISTPNWNILQSRAFTCILLDMVTTTSSLLLSSESSSNSNNYQFVPLPCQILGMKWEEYNYLVQSAILSFRMEE
jgi:hypothetical protein